MRVLVDTGVWYGFADEADNAASPKTIVKISGHLKKHSAVVLWPMAYEIMRTRFVKSQRIARGFERALSEQNVIWVDDAPYRQDAFDLALKSAISGRRPLSMIDCAMRLFLEDTNSNVEALITFNERDFVDVCQRRRIELLSENTRW